MDVLRAHGQALTVFTSVLAARPRSRTPLQDTVKALDAVIERRRALPGDEDGYGLATLHEIRRDLDQLTKGRPGKRQALHSA